MSRVGDLIEQQQRARWWAELLLAIATEAAWQVLGHQHGTRERFAAVILAQGAYRGAGLHTDSVRRRRWRRGARRMVATAQAVLEWRVRNQVASHA